MEKLLEISDSSLNEMSREELQKIDGGHPAYDIGFVIREIGILFYYGPTTGPYMVMGDVYLNYKSS